MTGQEIEYLLGIFFAVSACSSGPEGIKIEPIKAIAGGVLIALAVFGLSFIGARVH